MTQKTRIQNYLIGLAKSGKFYAVSYDPTSGLAQVADLIPANEVVPDSVLCNEIAASYARDKVNGRRLASKRSSWQFELIVHFNVEVTLELFEDSLLDPAPIIPAGDGYPQVVLELKSTRMAHPTTQGAGGTQAVFVLDTTLGRT